MNPTQRSSTTAIFNNSSGGLKRPTNRMTTYLAGSRGTQVASSSPTCKTKNPARHLELAHGIRTIPQLSDGQKLSAVVCVSAIRWCAAAWRHSSKLAFDDIR